MTAGERLPKRDNSEFLSGIIKFIIAIVFVIAGVVFYGMYMNRQNHTIRNLRNECRQLDSAIIDLSKNKINRYAELERLKDGRNITAKARKLGLRPPDENQVVQRLRLVKSDQGITVERNIVGYNRR